MSYSQRAKLAVIKMIQDGMSLREIEREFGIDRKDIREWRLRYKQGGEEALGRKQYTRIGFEARCAAVRDYLEEGMTYMQLSEKYKISRGRAKVYVAKYRKGGYDALREKRRGRPPKEV